MRVTDILRDIGHPVAYYPGLSRYLGGVKATVFFCQIFYWQDKAESEHGVHKTADELLAETGLTYEEQRAARKALRAVGVLIETEKRIEHKIYFRIDEDALEQLVTAGPSEQGKVQSAKREKSISRNGKSPVREMGKVHSAKSENPAPPTGETPPRGQGNDQFVNEGKTTAETTAEKNPQTPMSPAAPPTAVLVKGDSKLTPFEQWWRVWPRSPRKVARAACEARWRRVGLDADVAAIVAHTEAMKLTQPWRDGYEPAPLTYLNQRRWQDELPPTASEAAEQAEDAEWWATSAEAVERHAALIGFRAKHHDEPAPAYRVLVAKACGRGPWIDFVLKHAEKSGSQRFYEWVRAQIGEELLPADDYAS
ncbi:hypothetical protein [Burkholderia multivorans]|uniref:hypothetical protein n=1 Tax=Burkholderia multivorans TaxID=87883 RepID=UPI001B903661|nr:hypothetical protein [Burkholderia multivorans]MBR7899929.1 hypothetical protein [Burkholderia multivorans]